MKSSPPDQKALQTSIYKQACRRALEHLLGIVDGIVADGHIADSEVHFLSTWMSAHAEAAAEWPGSLIHRKVREILADGIITNTEKEHLLKVLQDVGATFFSESGSASAEVATLPIDDVVTVKMDGASICLTGEFIYGTRAACERLALRAGAMPSDSVSRRVDYLIIGTLVSPNWAHSSFGRKIQRAAELQESGHPIEIISERRWLDALQDG